MDKQVKESRSAPFVAPKFLERRSALPLKICWSYGAALLVRERLPKSGHNVEGTVESREYAVLLTPIAPKCSEASLLTLSCSEPVRARPSLGQKSAKRRYLWLNGAIQTREGELQ